MKKSIYLVLSMIAIVVLNSCSSSTKVLDSWKSDNISDMNDNNILVIARTADTQARIAFEQEIVNQLQSTGLTATPSFTRFPKMNPDEPVSEERQKLITTILDSEGYDGIVLTVLKDARETTNTVTSGGYYTGGMYSSYYPRYYGGFHGYYHHPYSYSTYGGYYTQPTTRTYTTKTYILETVIYDLTFPENQQLVAVVTTEIKDPSNVTSTAQDYVAAIVKSFAKKDAEKAKNK